MIWLKRSKTTKAGHNRRLRLNSNVQNAKLKQLEKKQFMAIRSRAFTVKKGFMRAK